MLDPFTSLSLATSVFQILEFSRTLLKRADEIRTSQHESSSGLRALEDSVAHLRKLSASLDTSKIDSDGASLSIDQAEAAKLAKSSKVLTDRISVALQEFKPKGQTGRMKSLKLAVKAEKHKGKLNVYEEEVSKKQVEVRDFMLQILFAGNSRVLSTCNELSRKDSTMGASVAKKLDNMRHELNEIFEHEKRGQNLVPAETVMSLLLNMVLEGRSIPITQRILRSLWFDAMPNRRISITKTFADTFEWVYMPDDELEEKKGFRVGFKDWLESGSGIYWISGKPGCGKSTLMKFLSTHPKTKAALKTWSGDAEVVTAPFYFSYYGSDTERTQLGLFKALLFEILRQCPSIAESLCVERWKAGGEDEFGFEEWNLEQVSVIIDRLRSQSFLYQGKEIRFCFFIDGLDEYYGDHNDIVDILRKMATCRNIKIIAASRPWNVFRDAFEHTKNQMLTLQDLTFDDIHQYADRKLMDFTQVASANSGDVSLADLVQEVTQKAQGVFLWVFLVVRDLRKGFQNSDSLIDVQRRLNRIPPDLEPYFARMFDTIEDFYREQTAQIFLLCIRSRDPPWLASIAHLEPRDSLATKFCGDEEMKPSEIKRLQDNLATRVNARCRDLVEIKQYELFQKIEFLHRTVREYLGNKETLELMVSWAGVDFNVPLALCRMALLTFKRLDDLVVTVEKNAMDDLRTLFIDQVLSHARDMENEQKQSPYNEVDELQRISSRLVLKKAWNSRKFWGFGLRDSSTETTPATDETFLKLCVASELSIYFTTYEERNKVYLAPSAAANLLLVAVDNVCRKTLENDHQTFGGTLPIVELLVVSHVDPNMPLSASSSTTLWAAFITLLLHQFLLVGKKPNQSAIGVLRIAAEALLRKGPRRPTTEQIPNLATAGKRYDECDVLSWCLGAEQTTAIVRLRPRNATREVLDGVKTSSFWKR